MRRAEESLDRRDSFARPVVGYLVFRGALHVLGYFFLLITIYHTWEGISRDGREWRICGREGVALTGLMRRRREHFLPQRRRERREKQKI